MVKNKNVTYIPAYFKIGVSHNWMASVIRLKYNFRTILEVSAITNPTEYDIRRYADDYGFPLNPGEEELMLVRLKDAPHNESFWTLRSVFAQQPTAIFLEAV